MDLSQYTCIVLFFRITPLAWALYNIGRSSCHIAGLVNIHLNTAVYCLPNTLCNFFPILSSYETGTSSHFLNVLFWFRKCLSYANDLCAEPTQATAAHLTRLTPTHIPLARQVMGPQPT